MILSLINWNVYGMGGDTSSGPEILQTFISDSGVRMDLVAQYKEYVESKKDSLNRETKQINKYLEFYAVLTVQADSPLHQRFQSGGLPVSLLYNTNGAGVAKINQLVSQNSRVIFLERRSSMVTRFIDPYFRNNGENKIDGESFYEINDE